MFIMRKSCFLGGASGVIIGVLATGANAADLQTVSRKTGWFLGVDAGSAFRSGDSSSRSAGAFFNGRVYGVKFDPALTLGGAIGYRFTSDWSAFLSYDYIDGDVRWMTDFGGSDGRFSGTAQSNVVLANIAYSKAILPATRLSGSIGAGISVNRLSTIDEAYSGVTYAQVEGDTTTNFAARAAINLEHEFTRSLTFSLGANVDYLGGFETAKTREVVGTTANEAIGAYELEDTISAAFTGRVAWKF